MSATESTAERMFAYGYDEVAGCECPAATAGWQPSDGDDSYEVAETFDQIIRDPSMEHEDIVPEQEAREAWMKAIRVVEDMHGEDSKWAEAGRDVASYLDWDE